MTDVLDIELQQLTGPNQRLGKLHRVQKLAEIWLVQKDVPELREAQGGGRDQLALTCIST